MNGPAAPRDCGGGGGGEIGTSDTENLSNHTQPAAVPILTGNTHRTQPGYGAFATKCYAER